MRLTLSFPASPREPVLAHPPTPLPPAWRERLSFWQRLFRMHEAFLRDPSDLSPDEALACREVMLCLLDEEGRAVREALPQFKTGLERDWLFAEADRLDAARTQLSPGGTCTARAWPSVLDRLTHHLRASPVDALRPLYLRLEASDLADHAGRAARLVQGLDEAMRLMAPTAQEDHWHASEKGACAAQQLDALGRVLQVQATRAHHTQRALGRLLDLDALLRPYGLRHEEAADYSRLLWAQRDALQRLQAGLRQTIAATQRRDVPMLTGTQRRAEALQAVADLHASAQALATHWRELRALHGPQHAPSPSPSTALH